MNTKQNKQELTYLMSFYEIKKMPIFDEDSFMGFMILNENNELKYSNQYALRYYNHIDYAIDAALRFIKEYVEDIKLFKSTEKVSIEIEYYADYKLEKTITETDTYDKLFESFEKSNNCLRYCNGWYYKIIDKDIKKLYLVWSKWITYGRSMDLYYGSGIVD